jgi:hypothetical protein
LSRVYAKRAVELLQDDLVRYRKLDFFEFDPVASFPNTEDDIVHIANIAYHVSAHQRAKYSQQHIRHDTLDVVQHLFQGH